ncbi:hypothetical protein [Geodermatophilus maliterrae]|uniref:Membrane protein involved in the export of O-antigen and teichoic acid n=1 Tax=Geodermatophilus maliterrae TaxID=3162531 RepID=A0ABV3XFD3_9ACTN
MLLGRTGALLQQAAVVLAGLLSGVLLARELGVVGRGDYSRVQVLYVLAPHLLSLGVPLALLPRSAAGPEPRIVLLHVVLAWTALAGLGLVVITPSSASYVVALLMIGPVLVGWSESFLVRSARETWVQPLRTVDVVSSSVAITVVGLLGTLSIEVAVVCLFLPTVAMRVPIVVWLRHGLRGPTHAGRSLYRHGAARLWPRELLGAVGFHADLIAAMLLLSPRELGVYAVASAIGRLGMAPYHAFYGESLRSVASGSALRVTLLRLVPVPTGMSLLGVAGLVLVGGPLVSLVFGEQYASAGPLAAALLAAFACGGLASLLETLITAGLPAAASVRPRLVSLLAGCGVWAAAYWLDLGLVGVVLGLAVTNVLVLTLTAFDLSRRSPAWLDA